MSRITQTIASQVAKKAVLKLKDKIHKAEEALSIKATEIVKSKIPESILKVFGSENNNYFHRTSTAYFEGTGISRDMSRVSLKETLPCLNGSSTVMVDTAEATIIVKLYHAVNDAEEIYDDMEAQVYNSLLALGTYKRVKAEFPELYSMLPAPQIKTLIIPTKDVRIKIAELIKD